MEEGLPHSEEAARLAGELLAALAEATASDSTFGVGDVGCLLLALLASDQSALHAEDEEGSTEQAERLFRSARTALDACCAARAAREEGWPLPGFPQLTAWLEARAADSLKRPFDWIEAYVEQKTAAGVQTGQMADGPQPAGTQPASQQLDSSGSSGSSGSSACSGAGASGGSSGAEDAQPSDSDSIAAAVALGSQLACIGMQALEALAVATSRATDLRALAAGMEAVAWLLVLRPPGFWPPDVLRGTWELLVHACRALGPKGAATGGAASSSGSGSGSGVGGRQAAGKRRSQAARQGGTAATNQQTAEAHSKEVAQQRGDWAFHSVAASWTLLLTWRVDLRGQLFPPAVVVERAALMLRVEGHTMQRMRAAYLLAAARPWLSAAAANQQMLLSHAPRQLIASLSWALDLKRLRVLGLTGESERFLRTRLLCLSHDVLRDVAQTAGTASCAAELPRCLQMVASIVRDTAELLPPACETAEQLRERAVELAETCGPEGGRTTTPGTPQELLGRCCLYFAALTTVLPGQALADERMLRALTDVMWRCPAPDLLDAAGTACWGLFDQFGRDTPLTFPMEVLDRVGAVLIAVLDGFGVFMQRLPAQERPRMYGVCRSVLSTFHNIRFEAETGAKAVAVVCRTIRKLARLPGMQPPLQLWLLLCAAEEMTHTGKLCGHPAREALDAEDIGVETCMAMVASLRMVAEQPHNFSGGEHTWQAQLASDAAFHVYLNTWAWPGLLEQLHQKNAPAALLRALCQPGLPADLSCRAVMSCLAVLARMDDHPDVLVKVIRSGLVHKLLVPQLRLVVDGFARTQVADRDFHGVAAVRLACSVLNIAWQPHLRQELGIGYAGTNGKESSTNGTEGCGGRQGCGGKQGGTNGKQGGGSPGKEAVPGGCGVDTCTCSAEAGECPCGSACCCGHEPFTVPDTSKLGFCWTELYELILEAMLMLWGTAVHEECEWSGHWVREMASVSVDGLGLLSACEPRIWVPFLSKRMIHRLADIGRLAKCSLHEVNVFGRSHFAKHGSGCVSCIVSFARVAESVVSLVQQCEGRPTLTLCLARQGLPSELRATAGIIERHFQEDEKFQELRASCLSMADSLAACEAKHPPPNSQQLRQLRRRLLDTLCDPELAASILQGGEGEQHEEEAEGEQLDEAAAAEQAAAALLQEEEAAEQRQQQQVRKKAKAAAKQRQAAAVADARRRQQQEAQEARRRQAEEEKAQRERQRRAAAEQTRRQREEEEAAAAERLRAEARKGAAEEAARQAAAEQERRQRAEAAAALAAARQAALDEARCRREQAEAAEQPRRRREEAAAAEQAARQAATAGQAEQQLAQQKQQQVACEPPAEQSPVPALEAALAAVQLETPAAGTAAGAAAGSSLAPKPTTSPNRSPPPLPAVPGGGRRQYRPLLHQQQAQQAQQGSAGASSASSAAASSNSSAAPSRAASPLPAPSPLSMHSLLAQMLPSEAGKGAAPAAAGMVTPPATPALPATPGLGAAQLASPTLPAGAVRMQHARPAGAQQQQQQQPAMAAVLQAMLPPGAPPLQARPAAVLAAMLPKSAQPGAPGVAAGAQQQQQQQTDQQQQAAPTQPPLQQPQAALECCVCLHNEPTVVSVPCGHRSLCAGCAAACWKAGHRDCPICRHKLEGLLDPGRGLIC